TPSGKTNRCLLAACTLKYERDAGERSSFRGLLTIDDDMHAHLDSLLVGLRRCLRFKPPFGSHGAARPRSEQQPPWFPCAQGIGRIQRSREAAAEYLDVVEPD